MKSGKTAVQKSRCNAADLLIQTTEAMQAMADQAQIQLVTQSIDVELWADSDRLLPTLTNLLSNAIKFSVPNGTVWMQAEIASAASA